MLTVMLRPATTPPRLQIATKCLFESGIVKVNVGAVEANVMLDTGVPAVGMFVPAAFASNQPEKVKPATEPALSTIVELAVTTLVPGTFGSAIAAAAPVWDVPD